MRTLLKSGNLIDGLGKYLEHTDLLLENGNIAQIGRNLPQPAPSSDLLVLDIKGKTVLPGLIDCHVHICRGNCVGETDPWTRAPEISEEEAGFLQETSGGLRDLASGIRNARRTLEAGFTTVRDVGLARDYSDIVLRETLHRSPRHFPGPRILASGGGIAITGGHGWYFEDGVSGIVEIDGVDEARKTARRQLKAGADILKIMATRAGGTALASGAPEMTIEEMRAICDEAHRLGKRVAAHAISAAGIKNAVLAGVDTIEHGCLADEQALDLMAERGVVLVSTLYPFYNQAHLAVANGYPADVVAPSLTIMETYPQTLRKARSAGVKIAIGSDCGLRNLTPHGENAAELELLVQLAGFTPMEAIQLATHAGAAALGLSDRIGSLQPGKQADIVVLNGNPLEDIRIIRDPDAIACVIHNGGIAVNRLGEPIV